MLGKWGIMISNFSQFYLCLLTSILTGSTELRDNEKAKLKKNKASESFCSWDSSKGFCKRLGNEEMS